jgi:hypothetical protein
VLLSGSCDERATTDNDSKKDVTHRNQRTDITYFVQPPSNPIGGGGREKRSELKPDIVCLHGVMLSSQEQFNGLSRRVRVSVLKKVLGTGSANSFLGEEALSFSGHTTNIITESQPQIT